jgi:hypothetical protein
VSHHFDSPTAIGDGRLNLCDLYVFPGPPGTTTLVLTANPDSGRSSPVTFRPDALYEFVIAADGGTVEDRALRMSFGEPDAGGRQEMRVRYAAGRPSRPGLAGTELGAGHTGDAFALDNGGQAWFGLAGDPFWGDAAALFAFQKGLAEDQYRAGLFTAAPGNMLAGRNVTAIALQVPDATFRGTGVAVWARLTLSGHAPGGRSTARPTRCCGHSSSLGGTRTPRRSTPARRPVTSPGSARPYGGPRHTWPR